MPAFSLAFRRYQGAQGSALVVQLLVPAVFVGLGVYQQLGEPSGIADGKVAGVVGAEDADRAGNAGAEDGDPGGQGLGDRVGAPPSCRDVSRSSRLPLSGGGHYELATEVAPRHRLATAFAELTLAV